MSRKMKLDFTGVESFQRAAEGEHVCKIASADVKQSQGGNDMIVIAYEVIKGESKSARVFENYPLIDTALWKLKGMLQAIGMKADGKVQIDLDKLIGKTLVVGVKHEEYEGKTRARVDYVSKLSAPVADEDEDLESSSDDDEDEVKEEKPRRQRREKPEEKKAPMPEPEDDDDWDDDDEEEKPAPKKPAKAEKPKAPEKPAKKAKEDDDDDDWDDDWDE